MPSKKLPNAREVEKYAKGLDAFLASKRASTAREIGRLGKANPALVEPLVHALVALIKDGEQSVREAASDAIVELAHSKPIVEKLVEELLICADDKNHDVRRDAFVMLIRMGESDKDSFKAALPQLLPLVESAVEEKRRAIVAVLEKVGYEGVEYSVLVSKTEQMLEEAYCGGADVSRAKDAYARAKEAMMKGDFAKFKARIKDAEGHAKASILVEPIWTVELGSEARCTTISADGDLCVIGTSKGEIICFDGTGKKLWTYTCAGAVNDLDMFSLGRYIVASSEDKHVRLFERDGKLVWRAHAGEPTKAVSISSNGNRIFVAGNSNDVYVFDRAGNTIENIGVEEGSPERLAQTASGELFAMCCGDHNAYLLDRQFHVKWVQAVGTCHHIDISLTGSKLVSGGKGNYINCFDNMGRLAWRFEGKHPFGGVAVNMDGTRVFGASGDMLYCFDGEGRQIWRYRSRAEITDVRVSMHGYYVVISTKSGLAFLHNYEAYRHALERFESNLFAVAAMGVDTSDAVASYSLASKDFASGNYKSGAKHAIEGESRLRTSKLLRTLDAIKKAKCFMDQGAKEGANVSRCRALLVEAVSALSDERYNDALAKAAEALDAMKGAMKAKEWNKFVDDLVSDL